MRFGGCRADHLPLRQALRRTDMSWKSHRRLAAFGLIALAAVCLRCDRAIYAQLPNETASPQVQTTATPQEQSKRPLDAWQAEVITRLQEVEKRLAEPGGDQTAEELKRQQQLLSRLDLTLSQAITEANRAQTLEQEIAESQEALDAFQRGDHAGSEAATFLELDETRDELATEQRRLSRWSDKADSASTALDAARRELKKRNSARRQARESRETNTDASQRSSLAAKLAVATVRSEIAEAEVRLREQEAANARLARASQELHVDLLKEQVSRLSAARFGEDELRRLNEELDRQKDTLEHQISEFEAASTRTKILETLWMEAQQKLDAGDGDPAVLDEQVETYRLELRAIQEELPLLRKQLERLAENRDIWQHRQQSYEGRPARATVREWLDETRKAAASLKVEEDNEQLDMEELQNELQTRQAALEEEPQSNRLERQVASLRSLLDAHNQNLASIRASQQLQSKLLSELESGSLAATFKDRLLDTWNAVGAVWNYELTSFGENSPLTVRQVVTALLLLLAGVAVSRALSRSLGRQVLRRLNIDASASASIQSLFYYLLLFFFTMFALKVVNVPLAAFTVLGGAVALGIGFGSQNIVNNFISGLILHAERPVKVGDLIQLGDLYGNVEHIGARSTRVRTGANLDIIVPNSTFLQNNVINFTLSSDKMRTSVEVGVVYGSPVVTVTQLLRRAVLETGRVSKDPPPIILFKDFGNSALVFEVHFWIHMRTMMDRLQVESSIRYQIEQLFKEEGIVVAFPQQDVHLDTSSPLSVRVLASPQDSAYS